MESNQTKNTLEEPQPTTKKTTETIPTSISSSIKKTMNSETTENNKTKPTKPKRRIIRRKKQHNQQSNNTEPPPELVKAILESSLPSNYNFEIYKTILKIQKLDSNDNINHHVALQFPEGLLMYSCIISDIIKKYLSLHKKQKDIQISILGDVTYGACCIDDLGAKALECDLLIHYGHSCLVPVQHTAVPCLYVFVEINIDISHLIKTVCATIPPYENIIYVMGTIQFRNAVSEVAQELTKCNRICVIPQSKPLSPGEVLGCTAPHLNCDKNEDNNRKPIILFISDGRFHLEAAMIANPNIPTLRYDPYGKILSHEYYTYSKMISLRKNAIKQAKTAKNWGIILGTLGRQGNPSILLHIKRLLKDANKNTFVLLLSEIYPAKLKLFEDVEAWVQIACPRLSIDWGHFFNVPILNSYELQQCLSSLSNTGLDDGDDEKSSSFIDEYYPMDYYSKDVRGPWGNYHESNVKRCSKS